MERIHYFVQRPATQARINKLMELGFHKPGDVETRLGHYVGQLGNQLTTTRAM